VLAAGFLVAGATLVMFWAADRIRTVVRGAPAAIASGPGRTTRSRPPTRRGAPSS